MIHVQISSQVIPSTPVSHNAQLPSSSESCLDRCQGSLTNESYLMQDQIRLPEYSLSALDKLSRRAMNIIPYIPRPAEEGYAIHLVYHFSKVK